MRYAIRCTPGDLVRDADTGNPVHCGTYAEAEAEAQRLTREARSHPHIAEIDFTPTPIDIQLH